MKSNHIFTLPRSEIHTLKKPDQPKKYEVLRKRATSNEYFVSLAFYKLKLTFMFQVYFKGGFTLRGGQVLDFLVWAPQPTPVQVYGDYWHSGQMSSDDRQKQADLEKFAGRQVIILWGRETDTEDKALEAVRRKVAP